MPTQPNNPRDAAAPARPTSARNVGPYRIIGRLGKGMVAEVLLTLQVNPSTDVRRLAVVKRVLPELMEEEPKVAEMLLDEARLSTRLSHTNVVQTYDVGRDGEVPYIAMEFLDGQSLDALQRRAHVLGRKIPVGVALRICCDALEGLHYAHELRDFDGTPLGVIHRDMTPSNVFVTYAGATKVLDFGIAKSAMQRQKTAAGVIKGKMAYMAPEQLHREPLTRTADIWSMGVVVWETLAGERLFRSASNYETIRAVLNRAVPPISSRRPDVPAAFDAILARALDRSAAARYQTAAELRVALEEAATAAGIPLRTADVAKLMRDVFAAAIEHSKTLVTQFLARADLDAPVSAETGEIALGGESRADAAAEDEGEQTEDEIVNPLAGGGAPAGIKPAPANAPPTPSPSAVAARTPLRGTRAEPPAVEGPPPARPAWHWALMAVGVLAILAAVVLLLRH